MRDIIDYFVVVASEGGALEERVRAKIKEGWQPFENITMYAYPGERFLYQTMVKYAPPEEQLVGAQTGRKINV